MATKKKTTKKTEARIVLVRSRDSGVWIGELVSQSGSDVTLTKARKIWRWRGANTTSELALHGCAVEYSRVAEPVDTTVLGCCEITESNAAAFAAVNACGWAK
jgi:hypothetical protein